MIRSLRQMAPARIAFGRAIGAALVAAALSVASGSLALAQTAKPDPKKAQGKPATAKPAAGKPAAGKKPDAKTTAKPAASTAKPSLVGTFGDWGVYSANTGKAKTCYALGQPKERLPASLKRDPAYVFISSRPGEGVRNEVSIVMGFEMKAGADMKAEIGPRAFDMVAKGTNLWVKNAAEEGQMLDAMKKGSRMVVKAPSLRGNVSTDSYSLNGIGPAIDRAAKECQ